QDQRNSEQKTILGQNVTVAATPNEATRLSLASTIGELRLMLKNAGDNTRINQVVTRASDLDKPVSSGDSSPADAGAGGAAPAPPAGPAPAPASPFGKSMRTRGSR